MQYWAGSFQGKINTILNGFNWTTEPPTQEGWYWVMLHDKLQVVEVGKMSNGELTYWEAGITAVTHDMSFVDFWLGPLPEPELPKE